MTSYRYLGTGTTNANGVATYNYPSKGAGDVNIVASLDNPIESDSIISDPFIVHDYYLYDSGVSDGQKNKNVIKGTNVTEQVTSNGTVLTCTNGTSLATAQYTYSKVIGGDFEAYITLTTPSSILMGFYGGNDSARISISNVENRTYKFKRTGSNWIVQYYNGSEWVDLSFYNNTLGNKDCRFYLYLYSNNETDTITFKDVKVTVEDSLNIGGDSIVQSGDTIGITGKFYEGGVPVKNIDLDIYKNGVKVGTVNTGSTGVASYSYEGSGVGEVNFQYKYGMFVSEIYEVLDCIKCDINNSLAVLDYSLRYDADSLSSIDDYKDFSTSETSGRRLYLPVTTTGDVRIEMEIKYTTNGNIGVIGSDGTTLQYGQFNNTKYTQNWTKVVMVQTDGVISMTASTDGGSTWETKPLNNNDAISIGRVLWTVANGHCYFRNVKVYPI